MDALNAILNRVTTPPAKMLDRPLDDQTVRTLLQAALSAPDHGMLRPWRFLRIEGDARVRLGDLFAAAVAKEVAGVSEGEIEKQRVAPLRAPLILVAVLKGEPDHPKIPLPEQRDSAACAVQNILIAAHAQGLASKWATGRHAKSSMVQEGLNLGPSETVMGYVYLGYANIIAAPQQRPQLEDYVKNWP